MSVTASGGSTQQSGNKADLSLEIEVRLDEQLGIRRSARPPQRPRPFTRREREILDLVGRGQSNAEIARALGISRRTVEKHLESIHSKAGTTSRARLVAFALSVTFPDE